jgi:phenylalanyl-tRNA synthetase beta chain
MLGALNISEDHPFRRYVSISNPLSKEQSVMRTTLLPGLLSTAVTNHNHKNSDLKIFEIGKVFFQEEGNLLPKEKLMLGGLVCGLRNEEAWNNRPEEADFYDLKGFLKNIFHSFSLKSLNFKNIGIFRTFIPVSAQVMVGEDLIGAIGEVHPMFLII